MQEVIVLTFVSDNGFSQKTNVCRTIGKLFSCPHLDPKDLQKFRNRSTDKVLMAKINFE